MNLTTLLRSIALPVIALAMVAFAPSASAHVNLASTSPSSGASVSAPRSVSATFTGTIRSGTITVRNAAGRKVSVGTGARDPRNVKRVSTTLNSGLAAGRYTVSWTIKAGDGHSKSGSFSFRIR